MSVETALAVRTALDLWNDNTPIWVFPTVRDTINFVRGETEHGSAFAVQTLKTAEFLIASQYDCAVVGSFQTDDKIVDYAVYIFLDNLHDVLSSLMTLFTSREMYEECARVQRCIQQIQLEDIGDEQKLG